MRGSVGGRSRTRSDAWARSPLPAWFSAVAAAAALGCVLAPVRGAHGHRCVHDEILGQVGAVPVQEAVEYGEGHPLARARERAARERERELAPEDYVYFYTGLPDVTTAPENMRVASFYYLEEMTSGNAADVKENLVPFAMAVVSTLLKVVRVEGNLKMPSDWPEDGICANKVMSEHQTSSVGVANADIVFYIGSGTCGVDENDPSGGGVPAACATFCALDKYGRPIGGAVELVESEMYAEGMNDGSRRWVLVHEIMHALGFSGFFAEYFFKDPSTGEPYTYNTIEQFAERGRTDVHRVVTPRVKQHARAHYGCDTLEGMELEGQGGNGTSGSHWDARLVLNSEVMGPTTASLESVVSEMTLAMFEDSGHYFPAYEEGGHLVEGFRAGCALASDACIDSSGDVVAGGETMFCSRDQETQYLCSSDRMAKASCASSTEWTAELPEEYQYYPGEPNRGGVFLYADYCPVVFPYSDGDCRLAVPGNNATYKWEAGGNQSRCFQTTLLPDIYVPVAADVGDLVYCLVHRCTTAGVLEVQFQEDWITCPEAGGRVSGPAGTSGDLLCPPAENLCFVNFDCPGGCGESDGHGCCNEHLGVCSCAAGRTGASCEVALNTYDGEAVAPTCRTATRTTYTHAPTPAPDGEPFPGSDDGSGARPSGPAHALAALAVPLVAPMYHP